MIPRGLLPGTPIRFDDVQEGDVIDTYSPDMEHHSRFHKRTGQTVTSTFWCDINTDYDMICRNLRLWIQLRHRPKNGENK